jgi:hypothetical protein
MFVNPGLAVYIRLVLAMGVMLSGGFSSPAKIDRIILYVAQPGAPAAIPNFVEPAAGCDWWGIGGQVFNLSGRPESGLVARITGTVDGLAVNQSVVTGSSLMFGPGGFHLRLANHLPVAASLRIQLFDAAGRQQSPVITLPIFRTCSQNLLVYNFRQRSFNNILYLPLTRR